MSQSPENATCTMCSQVIVRGHCQCSQYRISSTSYRSLPASIDDGTLTISSKRRASLAFDEDEEHYEPKRLKPTRVEDINHPLSAQPSSFGSIRVEDISAHANNGMERCPQESAISSPDLDSSSEAAENNQLVVYQSPKSLAQPTLALTRAGEMIQQHLGENNTCWLKELPGELRNKLWRLASSPTILWMCPCQNETGPLIQCSAPGRRDCSTEGGLCNALVDIQPSPVFGLTHAIRAQALELAELEKKALYWKTGFQSRKTLRVCSPDCLMQILDACDDRALRNIDEIILTVDHARAQPGYPQVSDEWYPSISSGVVWHNLAFFRYALDYKFAVAYITPEDDICQTESYAEDMLSPIRLRAVIDHSRKPAPVLAERRHWFSDKWDIRRSCLVNYKYDKDRTRIQLA